MNGKMIMAIPWKPSFDLKTTRTTAAPVWIELLTLNPVFEDIVEVLLGLVGTVVYPATKHARNKYSNDVRGYVKIDLTEPLKEYVVANVPGIGTFRIDVAYRTLPDACYYCQKRGHLIQDCKALRLAEEEDMKRQEVENGTFQPVA